MISPEPRRRFRTAATGGTFDHLHRGHLALLARSFEVAQRVVIGVTSDSFAAREGKKPDQDYGTRVSALELGIRELFPGREFLIAKLDDYFGPGIASSEVEAIVVTKETEARVPIANSLRAARNYPPLQVVIVEYVLAKDGAPISSTRIRSGEIDTEGNTLNAGRD